jgi:hypothetical protein
MNAIIPFAPPAFTLKVGEKLAARIWRQDEKAFDEDSDPLKLYAFTRGLVGMALDALEQRNPSDLCACDAVLEVRRWGATPPAGYVPVYLPGPLARKLQAASEALEPDSHGDIFAEVVLERIAGTPQFRQLMAR